MLNNLNAIAAGLLGLHGYPMQPMTWGIAPPGRDAAVSTRPGAHVRTPDNTRHPGKAPIAPTHRPACG
jgi:hypothetical protein